VRNLSLILFQLSQKQLDVKQHLCAHKENMIRHYNSFNWVDLLTKVLPNRDLFYLKVLRNNQ